MQEVDHTTCYCETIMDEDVMLSGNRTYCFAPDDKEGMKLLYTERCGDAFVIQK